MVIKRRKAKPLFKIVLIATLAIVLLIIGSTFGIVTSPVNRGNDTDIEVVIPAGTSTNKIATILKDKKLIKSEAMFILYVKLRSNGSLKADTYNLNQSMSLSEIINTLESGSKYNPNVVKITFKEGERLTDYAMEIATRTDNTYEEVIAKLNDKTYLNELITKYWFLTDNILQEDIYYPLEGYLSPDTYHFDNKQVEVSTIVETMLDQTEKNLSDYKVAMSSNPHYYMTMASLIELEGTNTTNRKMIAGIFQNRIGRGMNLGSDVTTYYALQYPMTSDLTTAQFATVNPYNTRSTTMMGKMPIGPICNPSMSSIEASVLPTTSTYLYFVADKKGNIYYTSTLQEHEQKVAEIKEKGDWIW